MTRVPVYLTRGWVPPGAAAWVPRPRTIVLSRNVTPNQTLVAHELVHVLQHERLGLLFYPVYWFHWVIGGFSHEGNAMEDEARQRANEPAMRVWAEDVMRKNGL